MKNIKVREVAKDTIKAIDKTATMAEKLKDSIVDIKEKSEESVSSSAISGTDYASQKIKYASIKTSEAAVNILNSYGKKAVKDTTRNIGKARTKFKEYKLKKKTKGKTNIKKRIGKSIKGKKAIANTKKVAQTQINTSRRIAQTTKKTAIATAKTIKATFKIAITSVKGIILGLKALISFLIAGGWIAVVVILLICMIGLLCNSVFGIFFSSEKTDKDSITMNTVISEINQDVADRINNIKKTVKHDEVKINSNQSEWKEVLSIYAVKISKGTNDLEVVTLNKNRIKILKDIFWDMNKISYKVKKSGNKRILHININSKTVEQMSILYGFNSKQKEQLKELLDPKYDKLWLSALYGTSVGSTDIVKIALSQVGNVGGEPYWSWFGFTSRIEWCAAFVSWVANQAGYIETGIIPKFTGCEQGVEWFQERGQWKEPGFVPKPGDIIFFDWEVDGSVSHVGIVEKVEDGMVHTVEGNSTDDMCRQKQYEIDNIFIYGYGTPAY